MYLIKKIFTLIILSSLFSQNPNSFMDSWGNIIQTEEVIEYFFGVFEILGISIEETGEKLIFINSNIIKSEGTVLMEEGCLSVPDIRAEIGRPDKITLRYQDLEQDIYENTFSGLVSRIIQHELDHLNGKFFVDYLTPSKRMLIHKRLMEISKNGKPSTGIIL